MGKNETTFLLVKVFDPLALIIVYRVRFIWVNVGNWEVARWGSSPESSPVLNGE